jgi:serine/threonine-protein phosphatase 2A regulatory subunit A
LDEEDEILLTLALELENFVDYVGGAPYAYTILPPLQMLCAFDEPLVRQQVFSPR